MGYIYRLVFTDQGCSYKYLSTPITVNNSKYVTEFAVLVDVHSFPRSIPRRVVGLIATLRHPNQAPAVKVSRYNVYKSYKTNNISTHCLLESVL